MSSRKFGEIGEKMPMFMNALINIADQRLLPVPDGELVLDKNNQAIGSVSITGNLSDEDDHCVVTGIQAAGLIAYTSKK